MTMYVFHNPSSSDPKIKKVQGAYFCEAVLTLPLLYNYNRNLYNSGLPPKSPQLYHKKLTL